MTSSDAARGGVEQGAAGQVTATSAYVSVGSAGPLDELVERVARCGGVVARSTDRRARRGAGQ